MNDSFTKHEFEAGLLERVRSWREVFPPLALLSALRVSGSPVYVGMWLLTILLIGFVFQDEVRSPAIQPPELAVSTSWIFKESPPGMIWRLLVSLIIVALPTAMTMRAGQFYAAGRDGESSIANAMHIGRRTITLIAVLMLPILCVLGLCVPIALLGLLDRLPTIGGGLAAVLGIVLIPLSILLGLISAGAIVAVPLAWASIAIEKRQDSFDAVSRGYEYLFRRPVQTAIYLICSLGLAIFVRYLMAWAAYAALTITDLVYRYSSEGELMPIAISLSLRYLPNAAFMTTLAATFGTTYLLLRRDANQQEIEDIVATDVDRHRNDLPVLRDNPN